MRLFSVVALVAVLSAAAFADDDEVFIRNVCDTLASKGHEPVTLVATDLVETKWVASKKSGDWEHGTSTKNELSSYETLQPIVKSTEYRFPLSIVAACRANDNVPFKYMAWTERKWKEKTLQYSTYIFDSHAISVGAYDATNTNNILIFVSAPPVEKEQYTSDEIMVSKPFEFAFEWWFAASEIKWQLTGGGYTMRYFNSAAHDSISAVRAMFEIMKTNMADPDKEIPDTISTANIQVIQVVLKDSEKTATIIEPASSSSVVPPSSSSDPPKSSANEPKSSASEQPKSSAEQSSSSSKDSPKSSASEPESSSSSGEDKPKSSAGESSSSGGKTSIAIMRNEAVDDEIVEMRGLDGTLVKRNAEVKPGIYYAKTSRGIWIRKAVMPR